MSLPISKPAVLININFRTIGNYRQYNFVFSDIIGPAMYSIVSVSYLVYDVISKYGDCPAFPEQCNNTLMTSSEFLNSPQT